MRNFLINLKWFPHQEGRIIIPPKVQTLFNLPKFVYKKVLTSITNNENYVEFLLPNSNLHIPLGLVDPFSSAEPRIEELPAAHSGTNARGHTFIDAVYKGETALVVCQGSYIGNSVRRYGMAVCPTLTYLENVQNLEGKEGWKVAPYTQLLKLFLTVLSNLQKSKV